MVDFISMTVNPLDAQVALPLGTSILGNFKNNTDAGNYQLDLMQANNANVETMKILTALNSMPEILKDKTINAIKVINFKEGKTKLVNLEESIKNFNILVSLGSIENNYINNSIKLTDTLTSIRSSIDELMTDSDNPNIFNSITGEERTDLAHNKLDMFRQMDKIWKSKHPELANPFKVGTDNSIATQINELIGAGLGYYSGLDLIGDSNISNWGVTKADFKYLLSSPFKYNLPDTTESGHRVTGPLGGAYLTSASSVQSKDLQSIYALFDNSIAQLRTEFTAEAKTITDATKQFYNEAGKSQINRMIIGNNYDLQNNLYRTNVDGKLDSRLILKNPYDSNSKLNSSEIKYLKTVLWSINRFRSNLTSEESKLSEVEGSKLPKIKELIENSDSGYFLAPLKKGTEVRRLSGLTASNLIQEAKQRFADLRDMIDTRELSPEQRINASKQNEDYSKMFNQHRMSPEARENLIKENPIHYYETNLDILGLDFVFAHTRERVMNDLLPIIHGAVTIVKMMGRYSGTDVSDVIKNLQNRVKITIFNEPIISKELMGVAHALQLPRKINSVLIIGMRPASYVKELLVGTVQNYTRAAFHVFGENSFNPVDLKHAYEIMAGTGIHKYGDAFAGKSDFADYTFIEALNNMYGMANKDINSSVRTTQVDRSGLFGGLSQYMYIWSTAPDFTNRMVILLAQMVHEGVLDAHSLDKNGNLEYDMSKDKRFDEYYKHKDNPKYTSENFLKQQSLYEVMLKTFIQEGYKNADGSNLKDGDDLPRAYTTKQKNSIKLASDTAYGFYDHEAKSDVDHMFQGLVYRQFQTYWTGKLRLWGGKPTSSSAMGDFVLERDENGAIKYNKVIFDENGNVAGTIQTTDSEGGTLKPSTIWQGSYQEGLLYSMLYTFRDITHMHANDSFKNKQRMGNLMLAASDLTVAFGLTYLLTMLFTGGSGDKKDVDPNSVIAYSTIMRATSEFDPFSSIGGMS